MRKLFSRKEMPATLFASSGEFVVPTHSESTWGRNLESIVRMQESSVLSKPEARELLSSKIGVTPRGIWTPSAGDDWGLISFLPRSPAIEVLKKCRGCGSTEHSGSRCSYCRGLV